MRFTVVADKIQLLKPPVLDDENFHVEVAAARNLNFADEQVGQTVDAAHKIKAVAIGARHVDSLRIFGGVSVRKKFRVLQVERRGIFRADVCEVVARKNFVVLRPKPIVQKFFVLADDANAVNRAFDVAELKTLSRPRIGSCPVERGLCGGANMRGEQNHQRGGKKIFHDFAHLMLSINSSNSRTLSFGPGAASG